MNNIHLTILGSTLFSNIINEIEFSNILNSKEQLNHNDNKISVKILFAENLKVKEVKSLLLQIDSNERSIIKEKIKVKLTEKELELILALNNKNGLNKSFLLKSIWKHSIDLDTHAFETHLHRLRKKMNKYFNDNNFIIEKNSLYYLTN